jgi:phosphoglycolate phosphatase
MRILLFDYDGVIANSFLVVFNIFNSVCEQYGLFKMNKDEFVHLYDDNFYVDVVKRGMKKENIPKMIEDFRSGFLKHKKEIQKFDKIEETVNELGRKNKIIIITSSETSVVKEFLKKFGIKADEVLGADVETSKIKKIESVKKRYQGAEFAFITDTSGDIKEGKKAGVACYGVTWGYHNEQQLMRQKPEKIFHSPQELLNFFNQ